MRGQGAKRLGNPLDKWNGLDPGRVGWHSVTRVYRMTAGKWKRWIQPDVDTDTDSDADTISEMDTNRNCL